jgi:hypothetical protein
MASLLNLAAEHCGIVAGVTHIHVDAIPKPWHIHGKYFGPGVRSLQILLLQGPVYAGRGAAAARHETDNRQN